MVSNSGQLARGLRRAFYVEFGLYGLWFGLSLQDGNTVAAALCGPLLTWLGIRLFAVGKNFLQTEWQKSPRSEAEKLGPLASLRLFWGELWITCLTYSFFFPFEQQFTPPEPKPGLSHQGLPIVLVPGFACNRGYFWLLRRWLQKAGYGQVYALTLEPVFGSVEANAKNLATQIESVCAHSGSDKVILIGHSMAGLTMRVYLHELNGEQRIAKIISLGAPHNGTTIAKGLGKIGKNLEQMQPNSEWSQAFNAATTDQPCPVPFINVVTPHDNIVAPQHSCRLPENYAKQVVLPGIGHLEMVASKPVLSVLLNELGQ